MARTLILLANWRSGQGGVCGCVRSETPAPCPEILVQPILGMEGTGMADDYETLKAELIASAPADAPSLSRAEVADWAYGNAVIENDAVTREMAERAANARSEG